MQKPNSTKVPFAENLISKLKRMKEEQFICDFIIKVGNKSYPVHRTVLVAVSDYFEALFRSNMKEAKQGFIEMKDMEAKAFEKSLEFMYAGSTDVTLDSADDILHIAELFRLEGLKDICFEYLVNSLSAKNCLHIVNVARTYNRQDVWEEAEAVLESNLETIINSELFLAISMHDLLRYTFNAEYQVSWEALVIWIGQNGGVSEVIKAIDLEKFPFAFLLKTILEEPCIQESVAAKSLVIHQLFADTETLEYSLDCDNCVPLKMMTQEVEVDSEIGYTIDLFLKVNFEEISQKPEFCLLPETIIFELFESDKLHYNSEMVKWYAAVRWVSHNTKMRKKLFTNLFKTIRLGMLPATFIRDIVREESFVKESKKCCDLLLDFFITNAVKSEEFASCDRAGSEDAYSGYSDEVSYSGEGDEEGAAGESLPWSDSIILDILPQDGIMLTESLTASLQAWNGFETMKIIYYYPAGEIKGIRYAEASFVAYLPIVKECAEILQWLQEAFNSSKTFLLEYSNRHAEGRIIWGNIPHITSGPTKDCHPNADYIERLILALDKILGNQDDPTTIAHMINQQDLMRCQKMQNRFASAKI